MQSKSTTKPAISSSVGCSPVLLVLVTAFAFFTISASIPSLNHWLARYALCPMASEAYLRESPGGVVEKLGVQNDVSTSVVRLYCEYGNAPLREIDNDVVVLTGFGVSAGLGAALGLMIYMLMYGKGKVSTS